MPDAIVTKDDLKDGCILFLKRWEDVDPRILQYYGLDKGLFNHPVLVLQSNPATGSPLVCLLTSFGDRPIQYSRHPKYYKDYIAIWPTPTPGSVYPQLRLTDGRELRKDGYLSIRNNFYVDMSMLKLYEWFRNADYYRLTPESFYTVVRRYMEEFNSARPKGRPERDMLPDLPTMEALILEAKLQIRQKRQQLKDMAEKSQTLKKAKALKAELPPQAPERAVRPWFWFMPLSVALGIISYLQPKLMRTTLKRCVTVATTTITTTIAVSWRALKSAAHATKSAIFRSLGAIRCLV